MIIGPAHDVPGRDARWEHVAGLSVGQDVSERILQMAATPPQFSLGKSYPGFGPVGPWLVTPDEFGNPDDLELGCSVNGEQMQKGRHPGPDLRRARADRAAVGGSRRCCPATSSSPARPAASAWAAARSAGSPPGDVLTSYIEGIGEMRHTFVAAPPE